MVQQLSSLSLPDELIYPDSDGKPLADNTTQLRYIFTIKGGLDALFKDRADVFIAADLFWYPVQLSPEQIQKLEEPQRQAPDVMVVFGRPKSERGSYQQWLEDNIPPQVAFEILSTGNKKQEMEKKKKFYQQHGIEEYYLYDPKKNRLQGWRRKGETLTAIPTMEGWRSPLLGITFSTNEEELVLFHPNGERFVSYVEIVEQRDRQRERAEYERAEKERERTEKERERTEKERERTEKEQTQMALEEERKKNQQLLDRLLELGVDPNSLP
ncbi:MAG: Uma2 family endonuclease [Symploca sp. SIO2E6]|nr:Uma2 family endonuclease [Symploca sp. SIO2E6]